MRLVLLACLVCCLTLSGCGAMAKYEANGEQPVNLLPTAREIRAGQ